MRWRIIMRQKRPLQRMRFICWFEEFFSTTCFCKFSRFHGQQYFVIIRIECFGASAINIVIFIIWYKLEDEIVFAVSYLLQNFQLCFGFSTDHNRGSLFAVCFHSHRQCFRRVFCVCDRFVLQLELPLLTFHGAHALEADRYTPWE